MNFSDLETHSSSNSFTNFDSPSPSSSSDIGSGLGLDESSLSKQDTAELQHFINVEQEKARLRAQVTAMTDVCWEKCMGYPSGKLDSKTEVCLDNCVQRFVDVTLLITNRFATLLQRQANM